MTCCGQGSGRRHGGHPTMDLVIIVLLHDILHLIAKPLKITPSTIGSSEVFITWFWGHSTKWACTITLTLFVHWLKLYIDQELEDKVCGLAAHTFFFFFNKMSSQMPNSYSCQQVGDPQKRRSSLKLRRPCSTCFLPQGTQVCQFLTARVVLWVSNFINQSSYVSLPINSLKIGSNIRTQKWVQIKYIRYKYCPDKLMSLQISSSICTQTSSHKLLHPNFSIQIFFYTNYFPDEQLHMNLWCKPFPNKICS